MGVMRPTLAWFTIVALPASYVLADDIPAAQAPRSVESFATVKKAHEDALKTRSAEIEAAYQQAKKNGKDKELKFAKPNPNILFSPRFLAIAERNPEGPEAIDALTMTFQTSYDPQPATVLATRAKAIKILRDYYAAKPSIKSFLKIVTEYDDDDSKALVAQVIAHHPDRNVQLAACKERVAHCENAIRFADSVKDRKRFAMLKKEFVTERIAKGESAKIEIEVLKQTLREKFGDLYNELSIGSAAPELKMQTVDGNEATLSALKGRIVVLDFWATWCGPCKAMISHEREMVERLKDKPFQLVGISVDDELKTLNDFLNKQKLPWAHWWAGPGGKESAIAEAWDIRLIPAIFVLDAKGVIRYKDLRGEELEKAVNALLQESETKPAEAADPAR